MTLNRKQKALVGFVVVLVAARIALPYVVLHVVNGILAEDAAPYVGRVDDIDIALYRGAYQIKDMRIEVVDSDVREPFLYVPVADLSVEWGSIFEGAFTGEVEVRQPEVVFSFSASPQDSAATEQTGEDVDWVTLVQDLMPITINRFAIVDGEAELLNAWADPR